MPTPDRRREQNAVAENSACIACHTDQAREWEGSRHHTAHTNDAYQKALAIEPSSFCRGCHAPEADPTHQAKPAVGALGVGCVTCHVTSPGTVLAAPLSNPLTYPPSSDPPSGLGASALPPHTIVRSADFAGAKACEHCHEFKFPVPRGNEDRDYMQTTVREHARASTANLTCSNCHMPETGSHRSHAFNQTRNTAWFVQTLAVKAEWSDPSTFQLTLAQQAPGHGFPTGDLFRRVHIHVEVRADSGEILYHENRVLARHFDLVPGYSGRQLTGDNRIFDEPLAIPFSVLLPTPHTQHSTLFWNVEYQRAATVGTGKNPDEVQIESVEPLQSGQIPVPEVTPNPQRSTGYQ
ncbi:MAG: hypothetical protein IPK82_25470 [Polyangiaceae bacterium]|nr:hypothetical protein [Polyangiaceae bacterium]